MTEPSVAPAAESSPSQPAETEAPAVASPVEEAPAEQPSLPEVNLLAAVETSLSVSSVYQGHDTQVARLVDGDSDTAWNSESGDLVGSYIQVRVPDSATVTGARIIVGFTHENNGRDLFTANQRVTKIKVTRGDELMGEFDLDPARRDLQPMAFTGAGGEYRFEITGVQAGSNEAWREICISEFQLLGTSPDAAEGRTPRLSVAASTAVEGTEVEEAEAGDELGDEDEPSDEEIERMAFPEMAEELAEVDAAPRLSRPEVMNGYERQAHDFEEDWMVLEDLLASLEERPVREDELMDYRRTALRRLAVFAAPGGATDALRFALTQHIDWTDEGERRRVMAADLLAMSTAMLALNTWLDEDRARCRWARAMGAVRIRRVMNYVSKAHRNREGENYPDLLDVMIELGDQEEAWSSNTQRAAGRIQRMERPDAWDVVGDWPAMMAEIANAQSSCGWE